MDVLPVDQHAPGARLIAAGDELEQGRLARAVRPHHTDDRRPVDREVGVQREGGLSLRPAALVALGQRLDTQQRVRHSQLLHRAVRGPRRMKCSRALTFGLRPVGDVHTPLCARELRASKARGQHPAGLSCAALACGEGALRCSLRGGADAPVRALPSDLATTDCGVPAFGIHTLRVPPRLPQGCGWVGQGANLRRRAAQCSEGQSAAPAADRREGVRHGRVQRQCGAIAAALAERAAQRTRPKGPGAAV